MAESIKKRKARQKKYQQSEAGKESSRRRQERYLGTLKGRAFQLYASAKQRATRYGVLFTITRQDVEERLVQCNSECEVTRTPLSLEARNDVRHNPYAPSLDQKTPGWGYTKENIQIVAVWYNRMKSDMSDLEAKQILLEAIAGISIK